MDTIIKNRKSFHEQTSFEDSKSLKKQVTTTTRKITFDFSTHIHPYISQCLNKLVNTNISGLQNMDTEMGENNNPLLYKEIFKNGEYVPEKFVTQYPVYDLDFSFKGAYSVYNWELFFHIPFALAITLTKNGQYEESRKWFHYIFDPTDTGDDPVPEKYWKFLKFKEYNKQKLIDELISFSKGGNDSLANTIEKWKKNPFKPHVVARGRISAYMYKTIMAYLDNLIAHGDMLFGIDSRESINEAMQLYVLAACILGTKPQLVPSKGNVTAQNYKSLRNSLDNFGNAIVNFETDMLFEYLPEPSESNSSANDNTQTTVISPYLYFSIPKNDKLYEYWDIVADRLFKIRNSLNLQGIFRELPLFQPPIDPGLLAKATASGLNVAAIMKGLHQPLPIIRFRSMLQKAFEICQQVQSLGNQLLSVIEKKDAEQLTLIRQDYEKSILEATKTIKFGQWKEAEKNYESLQTSMNNTFFRYKHYRQLLGDKEADIAEIDYKDIDSAKLFEFNTNGDNQYTLPEENTYSSGTSVDYSTAYSDILESAILNVHEKEELDKLKDAKDNQVAASVYDTLSAFCFLIPNFSVDLKFWGMGPGTSFGGQHIGQGLSGTATFRRAISNLRSYEATNAAKMASYKRREQEWKFQVLTLGKELNNMQKQKRAAEIRKLIAEKDYNNQVNQIDGFDKIDEFIKKTKISNLDFYKWMKTEVNSLYISCYKLALETAQKAERALQHELGDNTLTFINNNYRAGKEGLLAGEKLFFDLKKMEMEFHDLNVRTPEFTKHISLKQISPYNLLELKTTGVCEFGLPEELFDLDAPGYYFRRIKNVAVSIPCVTGPYTSINCKLTLLKSNIRKSDEVSVNDYPQKTEGDDTRFDVYYGSTKSIITSTAQNDNGMFDQSAGDDRYLPFEGSGVISRWKLELPDEFRQFDYNTISDVILHMQYTARNGGDNLKQEAQKHLRESYMANQNQLFIRLFSLRHDFPNEWQKAKNNSGIGIAIKIKKEDFPFLTQNKTIKIPKNSDSGPNDSLSLFYLKNDSFVELNNCISNNDDIVLNNEYESSEINISVENPSEQDDLLLFVNYVIN